MRHRSLLPPLVLIYSVLVCPSVVTASAPRSTQVNSKSVSQRPRWAEDEQKALRDKAKNGDAEAEFWLGAAYEQGWFGTSDFTEALKWLRRSAAHGNPDAQFSLGQMYEDGEGMKQNYRQAAKWYRKAAEHVPDFGGAGQGRNNLGLLYVKGLGVPRDYVQAYMWFSLANVEGNISYVERQMTPPQILGAERMASEWKSRHSTQ